MNQQAEETVGLKKVMLRYVNGPTDTYQCETTFQMGATGLVSAEASQEMLLLRYEGKGMFVLA